MADALALCLLVRDRERHRYPAYAVRWLGRFCLEETTRVELDEVAVVATSLIALLGEEPTAAAQALAQLFDARGRRELSTVLRKWQVEQAPTR